MAGSDDETPAGQFVEKGENHADVNDSEDHEANSQLVPATEEVSSNFTWKLNSRSVHQSIEIPKFFHYSYSYLFNEDSSKFMQVIQFEVSAFSSVR